MQCYTVWNTMIISKETYRIAGYFHWLQNFRENAFRVSRKNFLGFYFRGMNAWWSDHTLTSWWPRPTCKVKERHWMISKLVQQRPGLSLCVGLCNYESRTAAVGEKLACWTKGFSTADLVFDNFGASHTGSVAIFTEAGWFFLTVTIYSADIL